MFFVGIKCKFRFFDLWLEFFLYFIDVLIFFILVGDWERILGILGLFMEGEVE